METTIIPNPLSRFDSRLRRIRTLMQQGQCLIYDDFAPCWHLSGGEVVQTAVAEILITEASVVAIDPKLRPIDMAAAYQWKPNRADAASSAFEETTMTKTKTRMIAEILAPDPEAMDRVTDKLTELGFEIRPLGAIKMTNDPEYAVHATIGFSRQENVAHGRALLEAHGFESEAAVGAQEIWKKVILVRGKSQMEGYELHAWLMLLLGPIGGSVMSVGRE